MTSSYSQINPTPDFGAFDSDSDEDDQAPLVSQSTNTRNNSNSNSNHSHSNHSTNSTHPVPPSQSQSQSHPLSSTTPIPGAHLSAPRMIGIPASHSTTPPIHLPGSYDFEPQVNEGRPPPPPRSLSSSGGQPSVSSRRSSLSLPNGRGARNGSAVGMGNGAGGISATGATMRSGVVASWGARFLPAGMMERLLPAGALGTNNGAAAGDEGRLLFSQDGEHDDEDEEGDEGARSSTYPPPSGGRINPAAHVPLPSRPPSFAPPIGGTTASGRRVFGGGQGNDGVFANLSAKPDGVVRGSDFVGGEDGDKDDEVLPSYQAAAMDATPAYWETTVVTPGGFLGPDDICVDGLPVGNFFGFCWNMLVSMSFQFVGFLLTYLLHTTHAAKNGSRAGLGITLIQLGVYLKQRLDHPELFLPPGDATGLDGSAGPSLDVSSSPGDGGTVDLSHGGWSWWGAPPLPPDGLAPTDIASATQSALGAISTQLHGTLSSVWDSSDPDRIESVGLPSLGEVGDHAGQVIRGGREANEWLAFLLVTVGSFLFIGGVLSYWRAVRWARAVQQNQATQTAEANDVRILVE